LVNNAGGAGPNDPLKTTPEQFLKTLEWNVLPAFALTRLAVPLLRAGGAEQPGSVIDVASAAARYAQRSFSGYGTAKAALTQLTRLLAQDFAPTVRVNAIAPARWSPTHWPNISPPTFAVRWNGAHHWRDSAPSRTSQRPPCISRRPPRRG
jgi:7-alpha-hydroxysteroid dehydrogenase